MHRDSVEIVQLFDGNDVHRAAIRDLENALYAEAA